MNLELRRLELRDMYKLQSIVKQDIAEKSGIDWPFDRLTAMNFILNYNTWGMYINGDVLVGAIEVKPSLETAYFVSSQWQGQGIATLAVKQCIEIFGDRQLWCVINPNNRTSMRVAQKSGIRIKFIN
jgi:RimJ/RimL family protein N-acetyltransferase